jgi:hypothetical protein
MRTQQEIRTALQLEFRRATETLQVRGGFAADRPRSDRAVIIRASF